MHWPKSSDEPRLKVSGVSEWVCGMGSFSESWDAPRRAQVPKSLESEVGHCRDCVAAPGSERAQATVLGLSSLWRREAASQEKGAIETSWRRIEVRDIRTCGRGSERYNRQRSPLHRRLAGPLEELEHLEHTAQTLPNLLAVLRGPCIERGRRHLNELSLLRSPPLCAQSCD